MPEGQSSPGHFIKHCISTDCKVFSFVVLLNLLLFHDCSLNDAQKVSASLARENKFRYTSLLYLRMTDEQPLIEYFKSYIPLNVEERKFLDKRMSLRKVKRKQMILQEGLVCKFYSFVVEGCMRMYGVDAKGGEHNIQFAAENDWIADIGSFHSDKPSKLFIEALEPSTLLQIEKQDLYFLYRSIPKLDRIFKVIIENKFTELQNRVLQNISSTAQERYQSFLEQYPIHK